MVLCKIWNILNPKMKVFRIIFKKKKILYIKKEEFKEELLKEILHF